MTPHLRRGACRRPRFKPHLPRLSTSTRPGALHRADRPTASVPEQRPGVRERSRPDLGSTSAGPPRAQAGLTAEASVTFPGLGDSRFQTSAGATPLSPAA